MILLLKKKAILGEKENMGNQMHMIRVREGAVGVGQTERAITPSSDARTPVLTLQVSAFCPGPAEKNSGFETSIAHN